MSTTSNTTNSPARRTAEELAREGATKGAQECPACSSRWAFRDIAPHSVAICAECSCHYTTRAIYKGDSYSIVGAHWDTTDVGQETAVPFDLEALGSDGVSRRHGWFSPASRGIVQVG